MTRVFAWIVLLLAVAGLVYVGARALYFPPQDEGGVPLPGQVTSLPGGVPTRLRVPSVGIDAKVEQVGLTKAGNMATPSTFQTVAWYKFGTHPGRVGSAVIDGHVDNGLSLAGVFKHLDQVKVGDQLEVDIEDGTTQRYQVEEIQSYPYNEVPTELLFNRADAARLNLVTCGGVWLASKKTYDKRLVVFAKLI